MAIGSVAYQYCDRIEPEWGSTNTFKGETREKEQLWAGVAKQSRYTTTQLYTDPISHDGNVVRIRPEALVVGKPEAFLYDGVPVLVIKENDETVNFYYLPSE